LESVPVPGGAHGQHPDELAVVIPTRDRWPLLRTAVASALTQEDVDTHVVVVDDGSADRTARNLETLRDSRVLVLRNDRPQGVSAARNRGLSHTSAPWIAFLDDDDVWAPGYLAAMLDAVRASDVDLQRMGLVYSGHLVVDSDRNVTGISPAPPLRDVRDRMDRFNFVGCPSRVVLPTQAVRDVGGFDARLSILADWDLWVRIVAGRSFVRCAEELVGYMRHPGNMHLDGDRLLAELALIQHKHGWDLGLRLPGDMLPSYVAEAYRATGRRLRAARWYLRAFRVQRTPRDLGRAIGVVLGERFIELSGLRKHEAIDPSIGGWLEHVREAERATTTGLPPLPGVHRDEARHPGGYAAR
jgi:glycosyltransferase involved in cell wall biosynthesis